MIPGAGTSVPTVPSLGREERRPGAGVVGATLGSMHRWTIEDAATLLATVTSQKHPTTLSSVISGWDMLQVDRPSYERLQEATSVLVGSHLVVVDSSWRLRLTAEGEAVRRSVGRVGYMRQLPGLLAPALGERDLTGADVDLPREVYDGVVDDYLERAKRRAARPVRSRWWWPTMTGRR